MSQFYSKRLLAKQLCKAKNGVLDDSLLVTGAPFTVRNILVDFAVCD